MEQLEEALFSRGEILLGWKAIWKKILPIKKAYKLSPNFAKKIRFGSNNWLMGPKNLRGLREGI